MKARFFGASAFVRFALDEYFYILKHYSPVAWREAKNILVFAVLLPPAVFRFLFARVELVREISPHHAPLDKQNWERASAIELIHKI